MAETLRQKQSRFVRLMGLLIEYAYAHGFELTSGELWRTPEQAKLNAGRGLGIANSLHTERLAVDFNVFRNGKWLQSADEIRLLGEYWESLAPDCAWGGRFTRPVDPGHFSIRHGGRA